MCCVCANVEKKKHGTLVAYYTFFSLWLEIFAFFSFLFLLFQFEKPEGIVSLLKAIIRNHTQQQNRKKATKKKSLVVVEEETERDCKP